MQIPIFLRYHEAPGVEKLSAGSLGIGTAARPSATRIFRIVSDIRRLLTTTPSNRCALKTYDGINATTSPDIGRLGPGHLRFLCPTVLDTCAQHGSAVRRLPALGALLSTYILTSW